MISTDVVESALEGLRPGLVEDGFDLRIGSVSADGVVKIVLAAGDAACLDCLVPDSHIVQMIETAIRRQDPSLRSVELAREGFDDLTEH